MDAARKKLIDQVTKLLALAESNDNDHQAQAARNKAAELMAKHDIAFAEMSKEEPFTIETEPQDTSVKDDADFSCIRHSIAEFNGCCVIRHVTLHRDIEYKIVGKEGNIEAFYYMLSLVYSQRDAAWKAYNCRDQSIRKGWMVGFAKGVETKVRNFIDASKTKQKEWGLVPVDQYELAKDWYTIGHNVRYSKARINGFNADGYNAGKNVSLNKGVRGQGTVRRIGNG